MPLRENFAETAFFKPQLLTDRKGDVSLTFKVPDSVTSWSVWAVAFTKDLQAGVATAEAKSVKELMVRPYLPRFFREGDQAELKVVVNDAGAKDLAGALTIDIVDPETGASKLADFGIKDSTRTFAIKAGGGTDVSFPLMVPHGVGIVAFKVTAKAGSLSDGELRPLPILPSRLHLVQSRFVSLKDKDQRTMTFDDLGEARRPDDDQREDGRRRRRAAILRRAEGAAVLGALSVRVHGANAQPVPLDRHRLERLSALPGGRQDGAGDVEARGALEPFDDADPNRRMGIEESPWLMESRGDPNVGPVIDVLDSRIAKAERDEALLKLRKAQTASGGFPIVPGGPPSPYMTLYIAHGFAKASEFGIDVPKDVVVKAWDYLAKHYHENYASRLMKEDTDWIPDVLELRRQRLPRCRPGPATP